MDFAMKKSKRIQNKCIKSLPFLSILLMTIGLGLILFAMLPRLIGFIQYKHLQNYYNDLTGNVSIQADDLPSSTSPSPAEIPSSMSPVPTEVPSPSHSPQILSQFLPLLETNSEIIGWITLDDTPINYPLLQHDDNEYYLSHDPSNTASVYGSIYIDYRNDPSLHNQNTLIYGHNMNNGSMFHELLRFKEETFFNTHPYLSVSNLYKSFTYEVFSVYVVDADVETISPSFPNDEAFLSYLESCRTRSLYDREVSFSPTDEIITLVTCSYELSNARTIIQARRI